MPSPRIEKHEFLARFRSQFTDPSFDPLEDELEAVAHAAWAAYSASHKSPRTRKAGAGYADPDYELSVDWIATRDAITTAEREHEQPGASVRLLVVNASPRSEHSCPGESSKSWRLVEMARETLAAAGNVEIEVLDLSRVTSEYGRAIHPCKACFSTAATLCHWPCSCYPNYSLGQTHDWMNEIYPMWVRAHGVMIVTPVHWYQVASPLKLMMDRLVCADGGNPDPTSTHGKNAQKAKQLELAGWHYPRPLAGRFFSVVVHGDAEGAGNVRRSLVDWMESMHMRLASREAALDRYIGYWKPYATSHVDLDADEAVQQEVRNAAEILLASIRLDRDGRLTYPSTSATPPRDK